jgi:hypothetical protein
VVLSFKFYRITYSPPSRCSQFVSESFPSRKGTNRPKRWILGERGWWSMIRRRSPSSMIQKMTSLLTRTQATKEKTGRRRRKQGASRRSSTTTIATSPLIPKRTMTTTRKRKRSIQTFLSSRCRLTSSDLPATSGVEELLAGPLPLSEGLETAEETLGATSAGWGPQPGAPEMWIPRWGSRSPVWRTATPLSSRVGRQARTADHNLGLSQSGEIP